MTALIIYAVCGFILAVIIHFFIRHVLDFRVDGSGVFSASAVTCFVAAAVFFCMRRGFDGANGSMLGITYATTFLVALITGVLAFRLIIKSKSGRRLKWPVYTGVSFLFSVVPLVFVALLDLASGII